MRHDGAERAIFSSILEHGIREPLEGVDTKGVRILLNGFKRYRCALKLGIGMVPYSSLGDDEAFGIIQLIRISNSRALSILEQAMLIDELRNVYKMTVSDIAERLEKSRAWVSMRTGLMDEMSEGVKSSILNGKFPAYAYMYTLRQFIRMNCIKDLEIDRFVSFVSGKNLSIRDIERLAHGYFKGPQEFREQIMEGNITWGLSRMKELSRHTTGDSSELERGMLRDLEITQKYMHRVIYKSRDARLKSNSFYAQANLLTGGILSQIDIFSKAMRNFYDRSGQA
jgi:hypothetical protein